MFWFTTLSLVFGGCCSNAVTLEQLTSRYPHSGSLITFLQFAFISLHGFPNHFYWTRWGPRRKPTRIPLGPYIVKVAFFYLISLLNNAAFAYRVPMSVHIIFRSGGLVISMLFGWLFAKKRYSMTQILSVALVTLGVLLTTLSASNQKSSGSTDAPLRTYLTGIAILTAALILSGFLGLIQDWSYKKYGRPSLDDNGPGGWQESMFYMHFLGLPMFFSVRKDLVQQIRAVNHGEWSSHTVSVPRFVSSALGPVLSISPPYATSLSNVMSFSKAADTLAFTIRFPSAYLPLLINTSTQLVCVAGVNRLVTSVSALTVALILVVRKATSLVLSALVDFGTTSSTPEVHLPMMWTGAALVMLGTIGYSFGSIKSKPKVKDE